MIDGTVSVSVRAQAKKSHLAAAFLAASSLDQRNSALRAMASALRSNADRIAAANALDMENARRMVSAGEMSQALLNRLELSGVKIEHLAAGIEQLATLPDPLNRVTLETEIDDGLRLSRVTCPIGLIGVIFESRPDALPQIISLCLKSGNAVILKGGTEAAHSNRALAGILNVAHESSRSFLDTPIS